MSLSRWYLILLIFFLSAELYIAKKTSRTRSRNGGGSRTGGHNDHKRPVPNSDYNNLPSSSNSFNPNSYNGKSQYTPVESSYNKKQIPANQQNAPPPGWNIPNQPNSKTQSSSSLPNSNAQSAPIGWNIPGNKPTSGSSTNQKNPIWNSPQSKTATNQQQTAQKSGWASGYQTQGNKYNEGLVKKESTKMQQSSPNQPNAPQTNPAWKSGYQTHGAPPAYPHHNAAPPGYNGQTSWGAPPAYPGGHGYGGYGGYGHGYGQTGGYSGYGGYHSQPSFGGFNPGYGGMGGFGGGFGGYSPVKKQSFFSARTIGNVVAGMLVYNMASNLISYGLGLKRPYQVVNYYNQEPGKKIEDIKLPANVLTLCEGDVNKMCGQGTQSVCTQNGTVLCVATLNQATPCNQEGNQALCVNTTVPCVDLNDPLCQNSTLKDKLQAEVNVPCMTNLTLDVNLVDKDQTLPNTKYTYCVTTMAVAGPEYDVCENFKDSNDYRSVLNGKTEWFLETEEGFRRNYSVYTFHNPMESNGDINMPVTVLLKCSENALKLCPPGTITICTTFNEVMCMAKVSDVSECAEMNTTCFKSTIPCPENSNEEFCKNKTEGADNVSLDVPCFTNITLNAPFPKFNLAEFNGTLPDVSVTTSYTFNFNYCVMSLALPGSDFDMCITKEAKEKQSKT